jgi:hypothetical protein
VDPGRALLLAAAVPAVVAAAVFAAVRDASLRLGLALAAGSVAGFVAIAGVPGFLPVEAWKWLPHVAVAGAAVAVFEGRGAPVPEGLRWSVRGALCAGAAWVTVLEKSVPWVAGVTAGIALACVVADRAGRRAPPATFPLTVAIVGAATAGALVVAGMSVLGQIVGALAAAAGACAVLSGRFPPFATQAAPLASALLSCAALNGVLYAELPWSSAVLLAAAPAGAWLPDAPLGPFRRRWQVLVLRGIVVAAISGTAVALAVAAVPPLEY